MFKEKKFTVDNVYFVVMESDFSNSGTYYRYLYFKSNNNSVATSIFR